MASRNRGLRDVVESGGSSPSFSVPLSTHDGGLGRARVGVLRSHAARGALRWLLLATLVLGGAAGNLLRVLTWTQAAGFIAAPFRTTAASGGVRRVTGSTRVEVVAPAWRPLRVAFEARAIGGRPMALEITADGADLPRVAIDATGGGATASGATAGGVTAAGPTAGAATASASTASATNASDAPSGWRAVTFDSAHAAVSDGVVMLRLSTSALASRAAPASGAAPASEAGLAADAVPAAADAGAVEITGLRVTPILAALPILRHAGGGALFGLVVWTLLVWRGPARARRTSVAEEHAREEATFTTDFSARPAATARETLLAGVAIVALFAVWALGRPPLQTPDEPHQFLRATSLLNGPWVSGASTLTIDPRFYNPHSWGAPRLHGVIADRRPITREDIAALKATPWHDPAAPLPVAPTAYVAIISYPPLYYWSVFAIAQPITALAQLTPYQSYYLFRLAAVLMVSLVWTAVYVLLRRTRDTAPYAEAMLALLVLNPMLVFMSSGINSDALSIPLITLAMLCAWRTLTTGQGAALTFMVALAALWTKPSGAQMAGAVTVASAWGVWRGWALPARAWMTVRALALAGALAYATFYAWSPTQFTFEPGHATIGLAEYADHVVRALPDVWISFWGLLGWLDYRLAWPWYAAIFAVTLLCAALHVRARRHLPAFTQYALLYGLAFFGSTIVGGFINLKVAGYMLQGRYFLPAAIALTPFVMLDVRWQRWLLPACAALLHVLLFLATVDRYFGGDWSLLWDSLPFV